MGTALTQEQLAELGRTASSVYLALDADSAGQEAMLRAARAAKDRQLELRVVDMPEGSDPADLVLRDGADAFKERLRHARLVPDFHARRIVARSDIATARGRDDALSQVRPLVGQLADAPATRDELVRFLADRLNVDRNYLMTQMSGHAPATAARFETTASQRPKLDQVARAERTFLASACALGEVGREYVERLADDHFSFGPLRRVRAHLVAHWEDPLAELPEDDPTTTALIKEVVMRADDEEVTAEALRLDFLKLERWRVERALRHAEQEHDLDAQRSLARERQSLIEKFDELMGLAL